MKSGKKSLKLETEKVFGVTANDDPNQNVDLYMSEEKIHFMVEMAKSGVVQNRDGTPYVPELGVASVKIKDAKPGQLTSTTGTFRVRCRSSVVVLP